MNRFILALGFFVTTSGFAQSMVCNFSATTGNSFNAPMIVAGAPMSLSSVTCSTSQPGLCENQCNSQVVNQLPLLPLAGYRDSVCDNLNLPHGTNVWAYSRVGFSGPGMSAGVFGHVVRTNAVYSCPNGSTISGTTCTAPLIYSCPNGGNLTGTSCNVPIVYSCPAGSTVFKSSCLSPVIYGSSSADVSCPKGFVFTDKTKTQCTKPAMMSCPAGYSLDSNQLSCVKPAVKSCPAGFPAPSATATSCSVAATVSTPESCNFVRN